MEALYILALSLFALMPPHVTEINPRDGILLEGNILEIRGYSLGFADLGELRVVDLTRNKTVDVRTDLACRWVGKGNQPGARQQSCLLKVRLLKVLPGHVYETTFLNSTARFRSGGKGKGHPRSVDKLFPFEANETWGYRDAKGKIVIKARFLIAEPFSPEGIAAVLDPDNGWVYIDRAGKIVVKPYIFDNGPDYFQEGLSRFTEHNKFGYFDRAGKVVIEPKFDFAFPFYEGLAVVCEGCGKISDDEHYSVKGGRWGYIDKDGEVAIPLRYEGARRFQNGKGEVKLKGKWFQIDRNGRESATQDGEFSKDKSRSKE